jgi:3-hydroxybutyryl-CoA dehydrogenase
MARQSAGGISSSQAAPAVIDERGTVEECVSLEHIGVVGAGQMGNGIAHIAALSGLDVTLQDLDPNAVERALATIERNLGRQVTKGRLTEESATEALGRISTATEAKALGECGFIVEAATENLALKQRIFEQLSAVASPTSILASNTSSISITAIAAHTDCPDRVIGMHFMNPVPVMKLVEIIRGLATSDATTQTVHDLAVRMGKTPVQSSDMPGFVVNRVLLPYINEAVFVLHEGVASKEDIDTAMKLGTNVPMGPLTLADFIGLDTCLSILEVLHRDIGDPKYRPCPLLRKHVEAGWLGRKSGRGFYTYGG